MMAEADVDITAETYKEDSLVLESPNPDVEFRRRESWDGDARRRELCEEILREKYRDDKEMLKMKLEHELRLNEMRIAEERENRRFNEMRLAEEKEKRRIEEERENRRLDHEMKLKQMEIEESRRRDELTCRLKEQELEMTMQINESRNLDSTLTARTKRFTDALKGLVGEFPTDPAAVPGYFEYLENQFISYEVDEDVKPQILQASLGAKARSL